MTAVSFRDFMDPGINWFDDPRFVTAFAQLTGGEIMKEAAFTKPSGSYPGYINLQLTADGEIAITLRGDPQPPDEIGKPARLVLPLEEWHQLVAHANRLEIPTGRTEPIDMTPQPIPDAEHESDAIEVEAGGATAGDPLAQRDTHDQLAEERDVDRIP